VELDFDLQRFYNINRRALMWVVFFAILYLLRDFFAVMFLTFIFGFVMRTVAKFLTSATRAPYWAAVAFPYLMALTLLVLLMTTAIPRVVDEAADFSKRVPGLLRTLAGETQQAASKYGMEPVLARYVNAGAAEMPESEPTSQPERGAATMPAAVVDTGALIRKIQDVSLALLPGVENRGQRTLVPDLLGRFVRGVVGGTMQFLLAILLSFLIVLDFEGIAAELRNWRRSTVGRFFQEAGASVVEFSGVVGRAFQCQLLVALLNTVITCIGMFALQIEPLLLLTTIVFLLGLIPVLGVFISSVPIILIAFNNFGLTRALLALGMIVVVHLLEAYVFNPRIYAARFHLNPVIVLIILLVAHKLFGVWGMLLGIPVTHYVLNIAQVPARPRKQRAQRRESGQSASN